MSDAEGMGEDVQYGDEKMAVGRSPSGKDKKWSASS
jgi:hypothetical protein